MIADRGPQRSGDDSRQGDNQGRDDESADMDDPRVARAAQEYLAAIEAGKPLDQQQFLARHSDIAAGLAQCLEGLELVHAAAAGMRGADAAQKATPPAGQPPLPLGDFRILREIGRGGMGVVYEAIQLSLGRRVAVKILPFAAALDPKHLQRFKNESQAAAQLHHTNIVPVYAVGTERGVHFYAMQLIDGEPLSSLIENMRRLDGKPTRREGRSSSPSVLATELAAGRLADRRRSRGLADTETQAAAITPASATRASTGTSTDLAASHGTRPAYFRTVAQLMQQTAAALEHAHELGIIHRDIKPANLIVDRRGNIWVTDFGLAQFQADANLTRTGDMLGTLRYMSPEQAAGNRVVLDHRTDIYSLGVTLYELLTLEPAFGDNDRHDLIRRISEDEPAAPRLLDKSIPIELETIVLKAIAKAPHERYARAQDLADDLQRFLDDKPILARRPTLLERAARWRRRHRSVVLSAVLLLVLASIGLLGTTIVVAREHSKTKAAYLREAQQREAAEESFRQARQAVDAFTQLAEEELSNQPMLQPVRRKFLDLTVEYYRNFIQQRGDDSDPTVRAELAATTERVARIVDELSALQRFAPLMLLADARVQENLALSTEVSGEIDTLLLGLAADTEDDDEVGRLPSAAAKQHRVAELLRSTEKEIVGALTPDQLQRLHQIAWQQRGPFAFENADMVAALGLTAEQRAQISATIEQDRPGPRGRGPGQGPPPGPPPRRPGEDGSADRAPRNREAADDREDGFERRPADERGPGADHQRGPQFDDRGERRRDFGRGPGFGHGPDFDHGPGFGRGFDPGRGGGRGPGGDREPHGPGRGHGRMGPPPRRFQEDGEDRADPNGEAHRDDHDDSADQQRLTAADDSLPPRRRGPGPERPPQGPRPNRPPEARWIVWQRTIEKILLLLTPEQRDKWRDLTGEPLPYDLRLRLDE